MKLHTLIVIIFLFPTATLAVSGEPVELIRTATEHVLIELAQNPEIKSEPARLERLVEEIIVPNIDFTLMSRLTLGKNWRTATSEQRKRFTSEFKQLLMRTYSSSLSEYSGQEIEYTTLKEALDGKRSTVRTKLQQSGGPPVKVDYSLYKTQDDWKVYDVTIEGVSLAVNYRSSFGQEIRTYGMDGLIQHLATRNQETVRQQR